MSSENLKRTKYVERSIEFCREIARLLRVWKYDVSDDRLEGVELGPIRIVSTPSLTRLPSKREVVPLSSLASTRYPQIDAESVQDSEPVTSSEVEDPLISSLVLPVSEGHNNLSFSSNTLDSASSCSPFAESFSAEETEEFNFLVRFVNSYLNEEEEEDQLKEEDLAACIEACSQGAIPCLLLDALQPGTVDIRALNIPTPDHELSIIEKKQNHILCINSLAAISSQVKEKDSLDPEKLVLGDNHSILNLLRRIVNSATLGKIDVHRFRGLRALQEDEEEISHFLDQSPEELLIRWVNYRLSQLKDYQPIENINEDLIDCSVYLKLQNEIQHDLFDLEEALQ